MPRKNIMPFAGVSLTARAVTAVLASGCFTRVMVSTDDPGIAEEARQAGALVPFLRPASLADDNASSVDVLLHATDHMLKEFAVDQPSAVCLIQATSPMLTPQHISEAVDIFAKGGFNSLSSMVAVKQFPEWMFNVNPETMLATPESPAGIISPGSAIKKRHIENGAIYLVNRGWLMETGSLYDFGNHGCFIMSSEDSVDIDTRNDWDYAEFLFKRRQS